MEAMGQVTPPAVTESVIQAVLMRYAMEEKKHEFAIPNVTLIYPWEADTVSVTSSWLAHEYEIKISLADFRADRRKKAKHSDLEWRFTNKDRPRDPETKTQKYLFERGIIDLKPLVPNYFWYVTSFEVDRAELPPYAGWMMIEWHKKRGVFIVQTKKNAPRLHMDKMMEADRVRLGRWLAFKLTNMYRTTYLRPPSLKEQLIERVIETTCVCGKDSHTLPQLHEEWCEYRRIAGPREVNGEQVK